MLRTVIAAALVAVAAPALASGTLLTSDAGYSGRGINLSAFANGMYNFTYGPLAIDGFTFTAAPINPNNSGGSVVGQGSYGLLSNGSFGGNAAYIGVDAPGGYAQLLGAVGYSQLGFYFNYAPSSGDAPTIWTLDATGNVIDGFDLAALAPISTPGGFNQFAFRGVAYNDGTEIFGLRFGGSYILLTGTSDGSVPPPVGGVPEPATWALLLAGFGLVGFAARRRRIAATA